MGLGALLPNVIGSNGWSGVAIVESDTNAVNDNYIGTTPAGATGLGNSFHGVDIYNGKDNSISSNTIAYNGLSEDGDGVRIREVGAQRNIVTVNSIHHNGGQGINLINNANDNVPAPIIDSASCVAVSGTTCVTCTLEIFSDSEDEGQHVHSPPYATTNPTTGAFSWSGTVNGPNVTATAIDSALNTSEFSAPWVGACYRLQLPLILKNYP